MPKCVVKAYYPGIAVPYTHIIMQYIYILTPYPDIIIPEDVIMCNTILQYLQCLPLLIVIIYSKSIVSYPEFHTLYYIITTQIKL